MKLNKKGFTLIELLAVVVIMLAISVMAVSSISASIKRNNKKQDAAKIKVLESYAELYYQKYKAKYSNSGRICMNELVSEFSLSEEEKTYSDGNYITGCVTFNNGGNFTFNESN